MSDAGLHLDGGDAPPQGDGIERGRVRRAAPLIEAALRAGDGALANIALDRALADAPGYSMALLLQEALDAGMPPSAATLPMTPEQVAESYAARDSTRPSRRDHTGPGSPAAGSGSGT